MRINAIRWFFREIKRIVEAKKVTTVNSAAGVVFEFGGITGQRNEMFCFFHEITVTSIFSVKLKNS